jgi:hypothetical protein
MTLSEIPLCIVPGCHRTRGADIHKPDQPCPGDHEWWEDFVKRVPGKLIPHHEFVSDIWAMEGVTYD